MPRTRLVRGLSSATDEVPAAPDPALPPAPDADARLRLLHAGPPKLSTVGAPGVLRQVQMENIHPLRLRILLEIERTGSISAAAEACGIGQPSASMHLRTLEAAIGQRLVTRTGRGSTLTPGGKIVASHAARVLATLESMRGALDALGSQERGELTIAACLTSTIALLPQVLRRFSELYPSVVVTVRTAPSQSVVREITRSAAAIGIAGEVFSADAVVRRQLLVDELVGIAPVGLLASEDGSVSREVLTHHSLLLGPKGSSTRIVTERHLALAKYPPAKIWAFDSYEAIKRAVADGLGVSFVSALLVREEVRRGELAAFRLEGVGPMVRPICVIHSSATDPTPEAAAFMDLLFDAGDQPALAQPIDRLEDESRRAAAAGERSPPARHYGRRFGG